MKKKIKCKHCNGLGYTTVDKITISDIISRLAKIMKTDGDLEVFSQHGPTRYILKKNNLKHFIYTTFEYVYPSDRKNKDNAEEKVVVIRTT